MLAVLRNRNFALFWAGGLISQIGDWALFVALPMYVYRLSGSTLATSGAALTEIVPSLALSTIAGVYADRWDRRKTVIVVNLLLAVSLLPLIAVHSAASLWIVYVVAFSQAVISQFLFPAWNALLPQLVPEEDLVAANSLRSINASTARLVGPAIGGLASAASLGGAALVDSGSFLLVAIMVFLVAGTVAPARVRAAEVTAVRAFFGELLAGLALVRQSRIVATLVASHTIVSAGEGVFGVMFVVWVRQQFNGGTLQLGWFMSAQAIGGILGGLAVAHLGRKLPPVPVLGLGTLLFGLMDMALFTYPLFVPGVALGLALIVIVGFPGAAVGATWNALLQTYTDESYRGRIYGLIGAASGASTLVGTVVAGTLGGILGPIFLLNLLQGGGYLLAGSMVLFVLRTWRAPLTSGLPEQAPVPR